MYNVPFSLPWSTSCLLVGWHSMECTNSITFIGPLAWPIDMQFDMIFTGYFIRRIITGLRALVLEINEPAELNSILLYLLANSWVYKNSNRHSDMLSRDCFVAETAAHKITSLYRFCLPAGQTVIVARFFYHRPWCDSVIQQFEHLHMKYEHDL